MDDFTQGLIAVCVSILLFFTGLLIFLQAQGRLHLSRDVHLMNNCKVVQQTVGETSIREFKCKEQ